MLLIFLATTLLNMQVSLPQEIDGWTAPEKQETYDRNTIFDYMDGAGEIYLAYGFQSLAVQKYVKTQEPEITVEVFDMGSSEDAYGLFTYGQGRGRKESGIGQGSEYKSGLLCFWQDRFYVSIFASQALPPSEKAVIALGKEISNSIGKQGEIPVLISRLPKGLAGETIRYFHTDSILNYHYYVADENILNLDEHTKAVFADYADGSHLLLVQYPDEKQSEAAFGKFKNAFMPDAGDASVVQTEDGNWVVARPVREFVIVVFDAQTREEAETKLGSAISRLSDERE